jgi:RimJ/RimL family protein N-acetyltransferase
MTSIERPEASQMPGDVRLRAVTEDDLPILFEHQLDPEATAMAAFPARDREAFMAHWRTKVLGDDAVVKQAILVDGQVAGNIVSWVAEGQREVGYWLGRSYWGRGVATRALAAFLEQVTGRPLFAHVATHNVGSRRVLEKCGFRMVGESTVDEVAESLLRLDA